MYKTNDKIVSYVIDKSLNDDSRSKGESDQESLIEKIGVARITRQLSNPGGIKPDFDLSKLNQTERSLLQDFSNNTPRNVSKCPFTGATAAKKPFVLQNLLDGTQSVDTLHHQTTIKPPCTEDTCMGSIYMPEASNEVPPGELRPVEELKDDAVKFLKEYYKSLNKDASSEHANRVQNVINEIDTTGTYELTADELIFGARLAWRNAARCSGRIAWKKLELFDNRHVTTAKEMFDAVLHHIEYMTNKGNVRLPITVFPHKRERMSEFRVWNSQLIKYAGYTEPDGSVIGDPAGVKFTEICESMGWKGPRTNFDVLPLILQAAGQPPEMFEIPKHLILEVEIKHPNFPSLADMGLKWYGIPSVSGMLFDCGGLQFTACPFNGWYNATEIGARNLVDKNRYNLLKPIADCFGFETSNPSTLWKDRTVVELTYAVINSYQEAGVAIVDHHTAGEGFMKFVKDEEKSRGGCPTDWVWVVPPMSGALTPVFHQEFMNYKLRPSYEYQEDPWKFLPHAKLKRSSEKRKSFKSVARAALFSSLLMGKAMDKRNKLTILYASESGRSEAFAETVKDLFLHAFNPKVVCMDNYDINDLQNEKFVLVVTSTFGNGESPDNGKIFEDLMGEQVKKIVTGKNNPFGKLRYSVFALGSRAYPNFCAFGHLINKMLKQLGSEEITTIMEGDELSGQEESFQTWAAKAFKAACKLFQVKKVAIDDALSTITNASLDWKKGKYRLVTEKKSESLTSALSLLHRKKVVETKCISVENLQTPTSDRVTNLVKIDTNGMKELTYQPGDHLSVFPSNEEGLVSKLLTRIDTNINIDETARLEFLEGGLWLKSTKIPFASSIRDLFTYYLDITTPPTQKLLSLFASQCHDESETKTLKDLASDTDLYNEWMNNSYPNILEVLQQFPSIACDVTLLIKQLAILKPRLYSISSSPNLFANEVHITSSLVTYQVNDSIEHHGVCSHFLNNLKPGDVVTTTVRSSSSFHLPSSPSTPVVMIGPGTGIAPFRSFWQESLHQKKLNPELTDRKMVLYFGCRNSNHDDIYFDERTDAQLKGALSETHTAYSRNPGHEKVYVQHLLQQHTEKLRKIMLEEHGEIFVCGDVAMAKDVKETLAKILSENSVNDGDDILRDLQKSARYHEDIFGTLFDGRTNTKQ